MALSKTAQAIIEIVGSENVTDLLKDIQKETKKTGAEGKKSWAEFQMGMMALKANVTSVFEGIQALGEHMKAGAQAMAIESGFTRQVQNAGAAMVSFRSAVAGTVDDTTVQKFGANAARIGLSVTQTARAFELAAKASIETGTEFEQLMEQLLQGIGTGSKEAFEKLGIVTTEFEQALERAASNLGKTTAQLTGAEKAAIRTDIALDELGKSFGDVNLQISEMGQIKQLESDWGNFVSDLQIGLLKAGRLAMEIPKALASIAIWLRPGDDEGLTPERRAALLRKFQADMDKRQQEMRKREDAEKRRARERAGAADAAATGPFAPDDWWTQAGRKYTYAEQRKRRSLQADYEGFPSAEGKINDLMWSGLSAAEQNRPTIPIAVRRAEGLHAKQVAAHASMLEMYATASTAVEAEGGAVIARNLFRKIKALGDEWGWPAGLDSSTLVMGDPTKKKTKKRPLSDWEIELGKWIEAGGDPQFVQRTVGAGKGTAGQLTPLKPKQISAWDLWGERQHMVGQREISGAMAPALADLEGYDPEAPLGEADKERKRAILDSMIEFHEEMTTLNRDLVSTALQDSYDQLGGFGDSLVAMNDLFSVELPRFADMWQQMGAAGADGAQMLATSAPKMLALSSRIVGGMIKDKKAHSIVMGLFEIAQGLASAVTMGRQWESAGHFAAAAAYFVVAGKSGGGGAKGAGRGGGAGGGPAGRGLTPGARGGTLPPPQINIHVGTLIGDDEIAIRNLAQKLDRHTSYTGGGSEIP